MRDLSDDPSHYEPTLYLGGPRFCNFSIMYTYIEYQDSVFLYTVFSRLITLSRPGYSE